MVVLLIAGSVISVWQALRATVAGELARQEAIRADAAERSELKALAQTEADRGLTLARNYDWAGALLWFASAASREADSAITQANATRFTSWSRLLPHPKVAFQVAGTPEAGGFRFHPSEKYLSISYTHKTEDSRRVSVFNIDTSEPFPMPSQFRQPVAAVWSPSGEELAIATESGKVGILAFPSGELSVDLELPAEHQVFRLQFSQDGRFLALGGHQLSVWNM